MMNWEERILRTAERVSAMDRYLTLKAMDTLIGHVNDAGALVEWLEVMPEGAAEEEIMGAAAVEEHFAECVMAFLNIMRKYAAAGIRAGDGAFAAAAEGRE